MCMAVQRSLSWRSHLAEQWTWTLNSPLKQCCGSGMFIPDPGSWFLPIPDLGSQIPDPKTATKERGENFFCHTIFCSQKFHKIENYFIFEMLKKKIIWANFQRIIELFTQKIVNKLSKIWVWDPESEIRDPEKTYSRSWIQGSKRHRIRIRNTALKHGTYLRTKILKAMHNSSVFRIHIYFVHIPVQAFLSPMAYGDCTNKYIHISPYSILYTCTRIYYTVYISTCFSSHPVRLSDSLINMVTVIFLLPFSNLGLSEARGRILERDWDKEFPSLLLTVTSTNGFNFPLSPWATVVWNWFVM